ncbi:MAG: hypothetical protein GX357_07365 [Firmicutes bacterium]|nr:hypothetical protein [Bacillota bacterium]
MFAYKTYVQVEARFYPDGKLEPVCFWWNGRRISIDRVIDIRQACSLKAGGHGTRFTCRVSNKIIYLFFDQNGRWFVER